MVLTDRQCIIKSDGGGGQPGTGQSGEEAGPRSILLPVESAEWDRRDESGEEARGRVVVVSCSISYPQVYKRLLLPTTSRAI